MNDIELDLSDQEIAEVVSIYVLANLREESISVFKENLKEGIREALYKANKSPFLTCIVVLFSNKPLVSSGLADISTEPTVIIDPFIFCL